MILSTLFAWSVLLSAALPVLAQISPSSLPTTETTYTGDDDTTTYPTYTSTAGAPEFTSSGRTTPTGTTSTRLYTSPTGWPTGDTTAPVPPGINTTLATVPPTGNQTTTSPQSTPTGGDTDRTTTLDTGSPSPPSPEASTTAPDSSAPPSGQACGLALLIVAGAFVFVGL